MPRLLFPQGGGMNVIDLKGIVIPSINNKYIVARIRGRPQLVVDRRYREFKKLLISCARKVKIEPPYAIRIDVTCYIDIDNCVKAVLDALEESGILVNDRHVEELLIRKTPTKRGQLSSLLVDVDVAKIKIHRSIEYPQTFQICSSDLPSYSNLSLTSFHSV
jgi:Holliday junction resolvase RusA-like endonuclease